MKDKNRGEDWTDDSKSRLFGFLKYRRNRKMKHDKHSKTRLRDIHINNMNHHEEFVTEFSVDGKYKECRVMPFCKIECDDQRARSITEALTKNQSVLTQLDSLKFKNIAPEKAAGGISN